MLKACAHSVLRARAALATLPATALMALVALALLLPLAPSLAQTSLQSIPALNARVIDTTGTLSPDQLEVLERKLAAFEAAKGSQIVVLMVPTTQPEDIVDYAQRVGDLWKIGRQGVGDGLLLVVAKNDRVVRIATAKSLEGAVPDLAASRVIEQTITPRFRNGDFAGGLGAGIDQLTALITGEALPLPGPPQGPSADAGFDWLNLVLLLFFAAPFMARLLRGLLGRKAAALATGLALGVLAWLLTTSIVVAVLATMAGAVLALASALAASGPNVGWGQSGHRGGFGRGRGNGGFGGFGGGGFRSGGGGDFGGGGASGRW
jgi:uncharacterized protein